MKVFLSELAEAKFQILAEYLLENWSLKTRDKFISKLTDKIKQISTQPDSCPKSSDFDNLYKSVVTKQTTFFYRIKTEGKEILIYPEVSPKACRVQNADGCCTSTAQYSLNIKSYQQKSP